MQAAIMAVVSWALFWLASLYAGGLRDPRYLDGWLLAGGIGLQFLLHVALKAARLSPASLRRLRRFHIFTGSLLVFVFGYHLSFTLPDTAMEWTLAGCFTVISLSGILGSCTSSARLRTGTEYTSSERIAARHSQLASEAASALESAQDDGPTLSLPAPPYQAWLRELHDGHVSGFLTARPGVFALITASHSRLQPVMAAIDQLKPYLDTAANMKLATIRGLVIEKHELDRARVRLIVPAVWLFIHVSLTYSLIVLTVLHVVVAYAFSSEAW
jgi:hypothetical protein